MSDPERILRFWFGDPGTPPLARAPKWYAKDEAFDREIRESFEADLAAAVRGELDAWPKSSRSCLAFIVLCDQMPRNMYRDEPAAFEQDALALDACLRGRAEGLDRPLAHMERLFFYMPLMHAEDREIQAQSVAAFEALAMDAPEDVAKFLASGLDYTKRHRDIVERFDRFPHRNVILGRTTTPEEMEFLRQPGSSF